MTDVIKEEVDINETFDSTRKMVHGEPPKGTIAYDRKYGKYTAKGYLRKRPNPNKPPEPPEQVAEVLTKSMGAGEWIKDFVKSKNPKFAGKSKEKRKEMALGAFYSKEETESVDEGMFSPPKMITGKAAKNRRDYLRNYHPRLIAAKKAAGSSKDYDYEPQRDSETGGTKPSTHKNIYNSNKFKPATKMSFEAGLKRAAERAKSKT